MLFQGDHQYTSHLISDLDEHQWNEKYEELKSYFQKNGHSSVTSKEGSLSVWCVRQRQRYKKDKLSQEKIDLLEKINFAWDTIEQKWDQNFKELKLYFQKNGHTSVPRGEGLLGNWCHNQRTIFNTGKLNQERIDLLNNIGFKWKINN